MTEEEKEKAAKKAEDERLKPLIDAALEKNKKVDGLGNVSHRLPPKYVAFTVRWKCFWI